MASKFDAGNWIFSKSWESLGAFGEISDDFCGFSGEILGEFFGNFWGIFWGIFWEIWGGIFWGIFWEFFGIFFWNSLGILWDSFEIVWKVICI